MRYAVRWPAVSARGFSPELTCRVVGCHLSRVITGHLAVLPEPREQGGLNLRRVLAVARLAGGAQGQGILGWWGRWQGGGLAPGVLPPVVHGARVDAKARQQLEVSRLQVNRLTGQLGRVCRAQGEDDLVACIGIDPRLERRGQLPAVLVCQVKGRPQ